MNRQLKRFISLLLTLVLLLQVAPFSSLAVDINSEEEFKSWLVSRNIETSITIKGTEYLVNYETWKETKIIVYGDPLPRFKSDKLNDGRFYYGGRRGEWEYLGYNVDGKKVSNSAFPNDTKYMTAHKTTRYVKIPGAKHSWRGIDAEVIEWMKTKIFSYEYGKNPGEVPGFRLTDIPPSGKDFKDYAKLESAPSWQSKAVIYTHNRYGGRTYYKTFTLPPIGEGNNRVQGDITTYDMSGKPESHFVLKAGDDYIEFKAKVSSMARLGGGSFVNQIAENEGKILSLGSMDLGQRYASTVAKKLDNTATYTVRLERNEVEGRMEIKGSARLKNTYSKDSELFDYFSTYVTFDIQTKANDPVPPEPPKPPVVNPTAAIKGNVDPEGVEWSGEDSINADIRVDGEVFNVDPSKIVAVTLAVNGQSKVFTNKKAKVSHTFTLPINTRFFKTNPAKKNMSMTWNMSMTAVLTDGKTLTAFIAGKTVVARGILPPKVYINAPSKIKLGTPIDIFGYASSPSGLRIDKYSWIVEGNHVSSAQDKRVVKDHEFSSAGDHMINLAVEDTNGNQGVAEKAITVLPPTIDAAIGYKGQLKQYRKITVNTDNTHTPPKYPIKESSIDWSVNTGNDVKYKDPRIDQRRSFDFMSLDLGKVDLNVSMANTANYSDSADKTLNIARDLPPVAKVSVTPTIYRNQLKEATIKIFNKSYSEDKDQIGNMKVYLVFDQDNDNNFEEETKELLYSGTPKNEVSKIVRHVGRYKAILEVTETYKTLEGWENRVPYLSDQTEAIIEVDNLAPSMDLTLLNKTPVNLYFQLGDFEGMTKESLKSYITNNLSPQLEAHGYVLNEPKIIEESYKEVFDKSQLIFNEWSDITRSNNPFLSASGQYAVTMLPRTNNRSGNMYIHDLDKNKKVKLYSPASPYNYDDSYQPSLSISPIVETKEKFYFSIAQAENNHRGAVFYCWLYAVNKGDITDHQAYQIADYGRYGGRLYAYNIENLIIKDNLAIFNSSVGQMYSGEFSLVEGVNVLNLETGDNKTYPIADGYYDKVRALSKDKRYIEIGDYASMTKFIDLQAEESTSYLLETKPEDFEPGTTDIIKNKNYNNITVDKRVNSYYGRVTGYKYLRKNSVTGTNLAYLDLPTRTKDSYNRELAYTALHNINAPGRMYTGVGYYVTETISQYAKWYKSTFTTSTNQAVLKNDYKNGYVVAVDNATTKVFTEKFYLNELTDTLMKKDLAFIQVRSSIDPKLKQVNEATEGFAVTALEDMTDQLVKSLNKRYRSDKQGDKVMILAGEKYGFDTLYWDYESDPVKSLGYKLTHTNPNVYENSNGVYPFSGQYKEVVNNSSLVVTQVGEFEFEPSVQDNPSEDEAFASYRKWSEEGIKNTLLVHRRPIAAYEFNFYKGGYKVTDTSYDLDHQSQSNRGIVERKWKWRMGDDTWRNGLPKQTDVLEGQTYYTYLKVKDEEGVWSKPLVKEYTTGKLKKIPITLVAELESTKSSNPLNRFKPNNDVTWYDIKTTNQHDDIRLELSLWDAGNQLGSTKKVNYQADKGTKKDFKITWKDINYYINNSLVDDKRTYQLKIEAIDNQDETNKASIKKDITISKNGPPVITNLTTDPAFLYEGDFINPVVEVDDPDKDNLTIDIKVLEGSNELANASFRRVANNNSYKLIVMESGMKAAYGKSYTVRVRVTDPQGATSTREISVGALELSIIGKVKHTDKWNENRLKFNKRKGGDVNSPRPYNTFWSGEAFVLSADTTNIDPSSKVKAVKVIAGIIDDPKKSDGRKFKDTLSTDNKINWTGKIAEKGMMLRWGYYGQVPLTFRFKVLYSNGTIKSDDQVIVIDSQETFWKEHRSW